MVKTSILIFLALFGVNVFLIMWNMADRYEYFDLHGHEEGAPNNELLQLYSENVLGKATNSSEVQPRLGRILFDMSANISWTLQTGKVSKDACNTYSYVWSIHFPACVNLYHWRR